MLVYFESIANMDERVLLVNVLLIIAIMIFFMLTLGISIFVTMALFTSRVSAEQAGNLMVLALVPPSVLTILFLREVATKLYDRIHIRWGAGYSISK
jgi:hypothetical protein